MTQDQECKQEIKGERRHNAHIDGGDGLSLVRSDKAIRELDYRPASLETMFRDCIDWMIAEDLIRPRTVAQ